MNEIKKYNIFIFITTVIKSMIEIFIPIILFNKGISLKDILLFYLFKYIFLLIFANLIKLFKIKNKTLIYISSFVSIITYLLLYFSDKSFSYLILISFLYSLYLSFYWIYRHNTALSIIENKMTTERSSKFMIITLFGIIPSSIIGGYIINNLNIIILIIIIFVLTITSLFFITKENNVKEKSKLIKFPIQNKIFLFFEQFKFIALSLFPLYAYNKISNSYTYIGLLNALTALISILYIIFIAHKMDKNKKDYLSLMCILLCITWILKLLINNDIFFLIITALEGISRYALDTIVLRNIYSFGKNFDALHYNVYIENIRNISRIFIIFIIIILNSNIETIILFGILSLFISAFIKFDDGRNGYNSYKNYWKNQ